MDNFIESNLLFVNNIKNNIENDKTVLILDSIFKQVFDDIKFYYGNYNISKYDCQNKLGNSRLKFTLLTNYDFYFDIIDTNIKIVNYFINKPKTVIEIYYENNLWTISTNNYKELNNMLFDDNCKLIGKINEHNLNEIKHIFKDNKLYIHPFIYFDYMSMTSFENNYKINKKIKNKFVEFGNKLQKHNDKNEKLKMEYELKQKKIVEQYKIQNTNKREYYKKLLYQYEQGFIVLIIIILIIIIYLLILV
uniref:Uncharacterized protein n=1 Tax=viral metagenome TaxID=1070528 RepID=A0A6C0H6N1_9ZZZZ